MASRIQNKILGLGLDAQSDISHPSTTFLRFRQLNAELAPSGMIFEDDAGEIGKGDEFISSTGVYPVSFNPAARIDKYASAEFMVWAWGFALGNVTEATGTYTIKPIDPCANGLQLPYFSVVEQVCESGGMSLDNLFLGCCIEDVTWDFNYGPGRQSGRMTVNWVGSGRITTPSGVTVPAPVAEHYLLSGSMSLNINGIDYIAQATMLSGQIAWKNNLLAGAGFYPGSGMQSGAAVRGRLEMGVRASTMTFTARLLKNSLEYTKLLAQTTGTATITATFDATDTVTFNYPSVQFESVVNGEQDGIVDVTVTVATKSDPTNGVLTITAKCGITGIGQLGAGAAASEKKNGNGGGASDWGKQPPGTSFTPTDPNAGAQQQPSGG